MQQKRRPEAGIDMTEKAPGKFSDAANSRCLRRKNEMNGGNSYLLTPCERSAPAGIQESRNPSTFLKDDCFDRANKDLPADNL